MVCVPCICIPFLLWVFYKFINPWLSKLWSKPEEIARNVEVNLTCPLPKKPKKNNQKTSAEMDTAHMNDDDSDDSLVSKPEGGVESGERLKAD